MDTIDTHLFIDIIISEGATLMYHQDYDGVNTEVYTGPSGKKALICIEDEEITKRVASGYLKQLGMPDLIDRLFGPEQQ